MTPVGIVLDERYRRHQAGPGHPERPARLEAIESGLAEAGLLASCPRIEPRPIDPELVERVHTGEYLQRLRQACQEDRPFIDTPDSGICAESYRIAELAAGGVVEATRRIGTGEIKRAFCAVRPPGHHAEADRSMGFCLLNNVVIATHVLRAEFGLERVLILDWDVHHGNGTQHLFETEPAVLYVSLHGHPDTLYPGTGYESETGRGAGEGFTINVPLLPGTDDAAYREAFEARVIPPIDRFAPELILMSAGFDAHADDPVGNLRLSDEAFAWMTRTVVQLADRHADGRILSVLEGGYDLDVLRRCVTEHVSLMRDA
jgi:acetoin utilization deacetylase AcuC-like enzyme